MSIRNDSETGLATWQWRVKVPFDRDEGSERCVVRKLTK
jgi:hypothetical protein